MSAAASDSGLALQAATAQMVQMGPCLVEGMGEASMVAALNSWGAARDYDMLDLKANLNSTQVGVATAFDQAQEALLTIVRDFWAEAETMRQHGFRAVGGAPRARHHRGPHKVRRAKRALLGRPP